MACARMRGRPGGSMDIEKFTERSRGFIQSAQGLALRSGNQQFTPEHLLKVLLDDEEGLAARLINGGRRQRRARCAQARSRRWRNCPKSKGGSGQVYLAPRNRAAAGQRRTGGQEGGRSVSSPPNICCWRWPWPAAPKPRRF